MYVGNSGPLDGISWYSIWNRCWPLWALLRREREALRLPFLDPNHTAPAPSKSRAFHFDHFVNLFVFLIGVFDIAFLASWLNEHYIALGFVGMVLFRWYSIVYWENWRKEMKWKEKSKALESRPRHYREGIWKNCKQRRNDHGSSLFSRKIVLRNTLSG